MPKRSRSLDNFIDDSEDDGKRKPREQRERKRRAMSQPIFFIDHESRPSSSDELFRVMGTSRMPYEVTFVDHPQPAWACSCPDFARREGLFCKHIFFVLARVLNVEHDCRTCADVRRQFQDQQIARQFVYVPPPPTSSSSSSASSVQQKPWVGETCAICYEVFSEPDASTLVYCHQTCGKSLHRACFDGYQHVVGESRCPYCRSDMPNFASQAPHAGRRQRQRRRRRT